MYGEILAALVKKSSSGAIGATIMVTHSHKRTGIYASRKMWRTTVGMFIVAAAALSVFLLLRIHYLMGYLIPIDSKENGTVATLIKVNSSQENNTEIIITETIKILNELSQARNPSHLLEELLKKPLRNFQQQILRNSKDEWSKIHGNPKKIHLNNLLSIFLKQFDLNDLKFRMYKILPRQSLNGFKNFRDFGSTKTNITVCVIVCGDRREQAMIMLKSVVMFSLDANLHLVVVSDLDTILDVASDIITLKLGLNEIGYFGFTYELVREWYPNDPNGPNWKEMYRKCATQRLFLPGMLKHHDALIYLDTDILVVGNLTEMWNIFHREMKGMKMLGVTPNSESPGYYVPQMKLPMYGKNGINAGIMLLNLTQMRQFDFEARAKAIHTAFDKIIKLADQDIINVMAHGFPEKVLDITCAYNFYWIHCSNPMINCYKQNGTVNACFCNEALKQGLRILHGNSNSFYSMNANFPFMSSTFRAFKDLDIYTDSYSTLFANLSKTFNELRPLPCPPLSANNLYGNAQMFLNQIKL